ncbi:EpsG family protein [Marinomonas foliarum]|uniref:EpsG family protein n=1 Tax=Marinomonas foliarum TaxID=491950 RepID=A0ABX7IS53_9GAMM|nr:EpsG family protein [Marinomonas foliarum]QRV25177.1 EpsG family protein [Marinomonas foliarum]
MEANMLRIKEYISLMPILIFVFLVFLATVLSAYLSLDSLAYQEIFKKYSATGWSKIWLEIRDYEFFFLALAKVFNGWPSIIWFAIIALCSVSLKLILIHKGSRDFYLSVLLYVAYFFVLQDGTGIRVSLAIAIAFFGAFFFSTGRKFLAPFMITCAAFLFHYSLALFFLIFAFRGKKITYILILTWPCLIVLWWLGLSGISVIKMLVVHIDPEWIGFNQLRSYALRFNETSTPYSVQFIFLYIASVIVFFRFKDDLTSFEVICFNCVFVSLIFLAVFAGAEGLQNRVSEIFRFGLVFVFPLYYRFCLEVTKKPVIANVLIGIGLAGYFYYYVLRAGLIVWPDSWNVFL